MTQQTSKRVAALTAMVPMATAVTFAGSEGYAETVITQFGKTAPTGGVKFFDVNGDDLDDFKISVRNDGDKGFLEGERARGVDANTISKGLFFKDGRFAKEFFAGDTVGTKPNGLTNSEKYVFDKDTGALGGGVGDTAYFGFAIEAFSNDNDEVAFFSVDEEVEVPRDLTFGWLELERGSLILLRVGYDNTGAAAVIPGAAPPVVPVPASLLLLATGAAGLGALRRRQKKAA